MVATLSLLGPVELIDGEGHREPVGGAKQCGLLAWLALRAPGSSHIDHIIAALWGDDPSPSARNAVHVYVSRLRATLRRHGADIEKAGDGYRLIPGVLDIDSLLFDALVAEGRSALRSGDLDRSVERLGRAVSMWSGTPLSGLESLAYREATCLTLEMSRVGALCDLADGQLRSGRPGEARAVAEQVVALHPFDERGWRLLALAQYRGGDQAAALDTLRRVRRVLADELGLDPGPETVELERSILNHEVAGPEPPVPRQDGPTVAADEHTTTLPRLREPFLGRDDLVTDVVSRVLRHPLVSLVGLGGIGKTTTAVAAGHQLSRAGHRVSFVSLESEGHAAGALERVCREVGVDAGDDPVRAISAALLPEVQWVIVLDNAEQVAGLPAALAGVVGLPGLSLLVTSRRPLRLRDEDLVVVPPLPVRLQDGSPGPAMRLFQSSSGTAADVDSEVVGDVCQLLDGIPLAIELAGRRARVLPPDLVHAALLREGAANRVLTSRDRDRPERQSSIGAVVDASVALLEPAERELLSVASGVDGWVTLELLTAACADGTSPDSGAAACVLDEVAVMDGADALEAAGLVEVEAQGRLRVLTPVRQHLRSQAGQARSDTALAIALVSLVGDVAPTLFGPSAPDGLAHLEPLSDAIATILARGTGQGDAPVVAALVRGLHRYWLLSGRIQEALRVIDAACAVPGHDPSDQVHLDLLAGVWRSYLNDAASIGMLDRALARAVELGEPPDRALVGAWCCLAAVASHHGDLDTANRAATAAAQAAAVSGDPSLVSLARDLDGHVASNSGDHARAYRAHAAGVEDARRAGDRYDLVHVLVAAADSLLNLGRPTEAMALVDEAFELVGELDPVQTLSAVLVGRGAVLTALGRVASARGCLREVVRLGLGRYPDQMVMADGLYLLAVGAAMERVDDVAARLWGATDAIYRDEGANHEFRQLAQFVAVRAETRSRMGQAAFDGALAAGGAAPARVAAHAAEGVLWRQPRPPAPSPRLRR